MSSPGSKGSPLAGLHDQTPSPRQDTPPLTPQSVNGILSAVRIESSPSQHSMYNPDAPAVHGHNAMDVLLFPDQTPIVNDGGPTMDFGHGIMGAPNVMYNETNSTSIPIPQTRYRPHTSSDQRRYVDEVQLQPDILFFVTTPNGPKSGIPLRDAITSKFMRLIGRDEQLFQGSGPSIAIRLSWKGYPPWSRQIPTRDFRSPPSPITKSKLAKMVAKSVQRFIEEHKEREMEPNSDLRWAVGPGKIEVDDLLLVSLVHVAMGSWQAILHLNRPLRQTL